MTAGPIDLADVHVGLGYYDDPDDVYAWDVAEWDVGLWGDVAPVVEVDCDVLSVAINAGRDRPLDRFRAGTCTVELDDPTGIYSPWRTATVPEQYAAVRPGIDLYVWVVLDGDRYDRFRGRVDSIVDDWPEQKADEGTPHRITLHAVDGFADLAAFNGAAVGAVGAGETTGARVGRILTNAEYDGASDLDAGTVTVQATTLASPALDELGLTTDTERGALFVDRSGTLVFRDRNGLLSNDAYTSVNATLGDRPPDPDAPSEDREICYSEIELASDAALVRNQVSIARVGGSTVTAQDLTSIALYGIRTFRRLDLIHTSDAESSVIANDYLETFAFAQNRIESVTLELVTLSDDTAVLARVLGLDLLHLIEVRRRADGFQVVAKVQIQAFSERITPDRWTVVLRTFAAVPANVFRVAQWQDEVGIPESEDEWDVGLWGF